jgi:predicted nucleotidyltransferase
MSKVNTRTGLKPSDEKAIVEVVSSNSNAEGLILYGSRAKGTFRNGSDIDLVLKGDKLTLSDKFAIENELDDLMLPYKIDLALLHHISDEGLLEHISRVGIVLFDRKGASAN